jgi:hypothetical protein
VNSGGTAELHGTVHGEVHNNGGLIKVHGKVNGRVKNVKGMTTYSKDAVVHGVRILQYRIIK